MNACGAESMKAGRTVQVTVADGSVRGQWAVVFRSEAVPGTLAVFAGVLTLAGADIVSATVTRSRDDSVTDVFEVQPPAECPDPAPDLAAQLAEQAAAGLADERALHERIRGLRTPTPPSMLPPTVEVVADSEISSGIIVRAADRPGLLHDIAHVLSAHGMRARSLSALTFNGRAHDTFRIVDTTGMAPRDSAVLAELQTALLHELRI